MNPLSTKEKKALRGQAQRLKPAVQVGKAGLEASVLKELDQALRRDELVKVRFRAELVDRNTASEKIAAELNCTCVGGVGRTLSFFRQKETGE